MFFNTPLISLAITFANILGGYTVCPSGDIGVGTQGGESVIVANNCGQIDQKTGGGGCGSGFNQGSTVVCDSDSDPVSVQTPDGRDWGSCNVVNDGSCGGGLVVKSCCSLN
ncbi:hypothetical protein K439DRAFT_1663685 [Ramaria rubella]|nr:hypothetical protein K439DRAFT_1663685 [Ramaria rubella]